MSKDDIESQLERLKEEESQLRRRFNELQDIVQNAPGSHRPGQPSAEVLRAEREIHSVVLALVELERRRVELNVAGSLR
jgi:cell division septum initiation protein DivIVA